MRALGEFLAMFGNTVRDTLPIVIILIFFQFAVLRRPLANPRKIVIGFGYVLVGLTLFLLGLDQALFPIGRSMADQFTAPEFLGVSATATSVHWREYGWVYVFAFAIGFSTTIAEPALIAVASKADTLSAGAIEAWGLRVAVALGVAVGITIGVFRIIVGIPLFWFIVVGYVLVVVQTLFAPRLIVPLAYDSGGVTTSTVTVPIVTALGLGLAENVPGRSPLVDGFGLIAFASLFPILFVMIYAQGSEWRARRKRSPTPTEESVPDHAQGVEL